jgi:hypothetical protein
MKLFCTLLDDYRDASPKKDLDVVNLADVESFGEPACGPCGPHECGEVLQAVHTVELQ